MNTITYTISVLIVSCSCAISLTVFIIIVISEGVTAKHDVIFKSAMTIKTAHKVFHIVFDKTDTLTQDKLSVTEKVFLLKKQDLTTFITLSLTCNSKHPVFAVISTHLKKKDINAAKISDSKSVTDKSVDDIFNNVSVHCSNTD